MKFSQAMAGVADVSGVSPAGDPDIARVCEDSRKVRAGDLFLARGGTKVDGAKFIADAVAKGAVAVIEEASGQGKNAAVPAHVAFARVPDANLALSLLAHKVAGNPTAGMKMIGVTGTKGKTTVAYLMRSVLRAAGHKVGMIGTVEIDDGAKAVAADMTTPGATDLVGLFCRMRANGVTHCVMEVSSHALHQHRVAGIDFALAIFTNLTGDHLDYHKTMEEYAAAKAILFAGLSADAAAVVNIDDAFASQMVADCRAKVVPYCVAKSDDARPVPVSTGGGWTASIRRMAGDGMRVAIHSAAGEEMELGTPLVGRHNAYNLLSVVAGARAMGVSVGSLFKALETDSGAPGRLQPVVPPGMTRAKMPFQVLVDYAHTHDALQNVLSAVRATMAGGRLICVFGCGGDRDRTKRPKMAAAAEKLADHVIVTSDNPRTENPMAIIEEIKKGFSENAAGKVSIEADRRAAITQAIALAKPGDVVLIAGKGHENYQIIGTTKHHFDDVEESQKALLERTREKTTAHC